LDIWFCKTDLGYNCFLQKTPSGWRELTGELIEKFQGRYLFQQKVKLEPNNWYLTKNRKGAKTVLFYTGDGFTPYDLSKTTTEYPFCPDYEVDEVLYRMKEDI
jgi:hypothetical protein